MSNYYRKDIFPIHLYQAHLRNNSQIKNKILSNIQKCYEEKEMPIPNGWDTKSIYTTYDQDNLNLEIFPKEFVAEYYFPTLLNFFDKEVEFAINEIWFNYYIDGEYQEVHTHLSQNSLGANSQYSCIHFISYDDELHQPVKFVDPNESLRCLSFAMDSENYDSQYAPKIREGDLIMFPSYLQHFVPPSDPTPNKPRITVSMNIEIIRYGN